MLSSIINQVLTKRQREHGMSLAESEDMLFLECQGEVIARFNSTKVQVQDIWQAAESHIAGIITRQAEPVEQGDFNEVRN